MSDIMTQTWLERMWDEHRDEYLAECNAIGHQGDGADFMVWLEDKDLIPAEVYENE